jgi:hypothetical protein
MFDTETPFDLLPASGPRPAPVVDPLIEDLNWLPTGIMLSAALDRVDRSRLSGHERVSVLKARARLRAWIDAELLADIEAVSESVSELANHPDPDDQDVFDTTASEISTALALTRRASEVQTDLALTLRQRLPHVWRALSDGLIDLPRARVLSDQTVHLPEELARNVCDSALERASKQTTGQLRARIQRLIISIDPAAAKDRYEKRLTERMVVCEMTDAGTASIHATDLSADKANTAMCRINHLAHTVKRHGDRRGIDQIRADIFLDLLCGNHQEQEENSRSGGIGAVVDIRVELSTLLGLAEYPGEIPGYGPVIADVTRQLVENADRAEWRFGITHENQLVDVITTRRRPNKTQKRVVETRNPTCVFPGCRMPARQSDLDHQNPWAVTHRTQTSGLEPLCRYHHQLKGRAWKLGTNPSRPGTYIWTSPLGHTYTTGPDPP